MNHEWNLCTYRYSEWANETKSFSIFNVEKLETAVETNVQFLLSTATERDSEAWADEKGKLFSSLVSSSSPHRRVYQDLVFNGNGTEHWTHRKQATMAFILHWILCEGKNTLAFKCQFIFMYYSLLKWWEKKGENKRLLHRSHLYRFSSVLLHNNSLYHSLSLCSRERGTRLNLTQMADSLIIDIVAFALLLLSETVHCLQCSGYPDPRSHPYAFWV